MIRLTRINGSEFSLNPDLIHRAEETPDTVLTLIDGSRYVVVEGLDELIRRIVGYRARVVAEAGRLSAEDLDAAAELLESRPVPRAVPAVPARRDPSEPSPATGAEVADVLRLRTRRA